MSLSSGIDLLKLIFIELTETGTEKKVSIRADLIGVIKDSVRGYTDVYIDMDLDGTKVIQVVQTRKEIIDGMGNAFSQHKKDANDR